MSLEELSNQETIEANNNSEVKVESNFTIDENVLENQEELERVLEAVIYVEGTVSISRLRNLFKCENTDIRNYIENINNRYKSVGSAIEILEIGDSVMMTIIPSTFGTLSAIYDRKRKKKISKAMLL